MKKAFVVALCVLISGCSGAKPDGAEAEPTTLEAGANESSNDKIDYDYTAPHEETSTENLIKEIEHYDCDGLEEEVCATRVAIRQLELEERGICLDASGLFGSCDKLKERRKAAVSKPDDEEPACDTHEKMAASLKGDHYELSETRKSDDGSLIEAWEYVPRMEAGGHSAGAPAVIEVTHTDSRDCVKAS